MFGRIENFARILSVLTIALVLSACGEDRTGSIPNATDPFSGNGGTIPSGRASGTIADLLVGAVQVNLYETSTYAAIEDILKPTHYFYAPIVGNPLVLMDLKASTASTITEKVYLGVEDSRQGWAAAIPVVSGATSRSSTALDMTFTDNYLTVRIKGAISGSTLNTAVIYYRNRVGHYSGTTWVPDEQQCFTRGTLDTATPCRDIYMDTTNSNVKKLGSFSATYTNWVK